MIVVELRKTMKNNGEIIVKPIDKELAKQMCVENHYSHKWGASFGRYNFGIFKADKPDKCLGCAVFGAMMNPQSYKSINSMATYENLIELNRLWVDDCLGKNTETVFLSLCFKWFKHNSPVKIVQSFADGRLGCGTIYKASNFKYYGCSKTLFFDNVITGEVVHKVPTENTKNIGAFVGHNLGIVRGKYNAFHVKTYRYIFYIDRDYEKYSCYKEQPYPVYDKGKEYFEFTQAINVMTRCYLICEHLGMHEVAEEFMAYAKLHYSDEQIEKSLEQSKNNKSLVEYFNDDKKDKEHDKRRIVGFDGKLK